MRSDERVTIPLDSPDPWRFLLRAILLVAATGAFLLLMSTMASALDVPDATETVGDTADAVGDATDGVAETATGLIGTTDAAEDTTDPTGNTTDAVGATTETVGETATDTVGTTSETAGETADAATVAVDQVVDDAAETTVTTTKVVGDPTDGVVGAAGDTVEAGASLVQRLADDTLGGVSSTLDTTTTTLSGLVTDVSEATTTGAVPIPPLLPGSSDHGFDTAGSSQPTGPLPQASPGGRSTLPRETLALTPFDVHLATTGAVRPDPGGAMPGGPPTDGAPSPLDAAAAALSSFTEAGGASLVWAFLALLALLPAMGDRWLRFVRAAPPLAPLVAADGRPG